MKNILDKACKAMECSQANEEYNERHGIRSAGVLTVFDEETASLIADHLAPRVKGKTVVEIGGGIGLLSMHLGLIAHRVYCIEANPMWSWTFAECLLHLKPKNVSFLFGAADEFTGMIRADVALFCTHSDVAGMSAIAARFAPIVIDIYGELIAANPEAFDATARRVRELV